MSCHQDGSNGGNSGTSAEAPQPGGGGSSSASGRDPFQLAAALEAALAGAGFGPVQPMNVQWYNDLVKEFALPLRQLPTFGRGDAHGNTNTDAGDQSDEQGCLALLVASTGSAWQPFLDWLRARPERATWQDPFDDFGREVLEAALASTLHSTGVNFEVFWSFEESQDRLVSMQRAAAVSGLAELDHSVHLCAHPIYGTWFSLRALVICDLPGLRSKPEPLPPLPPEDIERGRLALEAAIAGSVAEAPPPTDAPKEPHEGGSAAPESETSEAAATTTTTTTAKRAEVKAAWSKAGVEDPEAACSAWRKWVAVRDAVTHGREYRFCEDQLEYHYTKDLAVLKRLVAADR